MNVMNVMYVYTNNVYTWHGTADETYNVCL